MNEMNNFGNNQYPFNSQMFNSNITFVTSLDEALYRTNYRNSDMIYFHQDQNIFYRVKVDGDGRKTWAQFNYVAPDENINTPATKADLNGLIKRIETLEKSILKPEVNDGELNGPN